MRTIEQIRERKREKKYKWGHDLIHFLTPYYKAGLTAQEIVQILIVEYDIEISADKLYALKGRYYTKEDKKYEVQQISKSSSLKNNSELSKTDKIAQNQEPTTPRILDFDIDGCCDDSFVRPPRIISTKY